MTTPEFLLWVTEFLKSNKKAALLVLAFVLFFSASAVGFTELIISVLQIAAPPPYSLTIGLLIFCYALAHLILSALGLIHSAGTRAFGAIWASARAAYRIYRAKCANRKEITHRISTKLNELSSEEKQFLALFSPDGTALEALSHTLLPHSIYVAHSSLIKKELIAKLPRPRGSTFESFSLSAEAIPALRTHVFHGETPTSTIELHLGHVAGSGASGGGAHSQTYRL